MKASFVLVAIPLLLAGCAEGPGLATPGDPAPRAVTLYRDTVTVEMRDGALCTGVRPAGQGPWRTTLRGCPHTWPVSVLRPTERPRLPLAPEDAAPWVTLSPPGGAAMGYGPRLGS
ncbi:hypothetical protein [Palleronia sp. LCG004]|uniref:hypothetical protein n=1 Tax=Palleronia sp. LCG004 TaxID=3079304 RepID=UPI0029437136|nr:hypothetical protein [Palleronia sp. LCG004]WOI55794.1 hypothetical protein RVY76_12225 [Palleronia sp. LCG004]